MAEEAWRQAIRQKLEELKGRPKGGSGIDYWQCPSSEPGSVGAPIRLVKPSYFGDTTPPWLCVKKWKLFGLGIRRSIDAPFFYRQPDPIQTLKHDMANSQSADDRALAKGLGPQERYLLPIVDLNDQAKGVQVWECPITAFESILEICATPDMGVLWDTHAGHDLYVKKTGKDMDTEYHVTARPIRTPLPNAERLQAAADKTDLARCVIVETAETIEEILNGIDDKDAARRRRDERDAKLGRPLPLFLDPSAKLEPAAPAAPAASAQPAPQAAAPEPPKPSVTRRKKTEPPPVPAAPAPPKPKIEDFAIGSAVRFDCDGEKLLGEVIGHDTKKGEVVVDAGGEEFGIPPSLLFPAALPPADPPKPAARRSIGGATAAAPAEPPDDIPFDPDPPKSKPADDIPLPPAPGETDLPASLTECKTPAERRRWLENRMAKLGQKDKEGAK